jgi:DNA-binding response OmpR family regulator
MLDAHVKAAWSYVLDEPVRILLADDDPILREFGSVHLSTPTATVVPAPDGMAALGLLKTESFDLVLLDIEMPALDGFALLQTIREDAALNQLPVMMLTGHEDIVSIDRAFRLGANAFASKPVNWRLLSYQIRYVLRSCALERHLRGCAAGLAGKPPSSAEQTLRDRCRAILVEARSLSEAAQMAAPTPAAACLDRIAKLAREALESPIAAMSAPTLAPERLDAGD